MLSRTVHLVFGGFERSAPFEGPVGSCRQHSNRVGNCCVNCKLRRKILYLSPTISQIIPVRMPPSRASSSWVSPVVNISFPSCLMSSSLRIRLRLSVHTETSTLLTSDMESWHCFAIVLGVVNSKSARVMILPGFMNEHDIFIVNR